jgi:uncharacterized protein YidB (DUF937 family)
MKPAMTPRMIQLIIPIFFLSIPPPADHGHMIVKSSSQLEIPPGCSILEDGPGRYGGSIMGLFDNAVPGGNITKPLMIALGALLVGKMLSGKSAEQPGEPAQPQTPAPTGTTASGDGGLLGGLGGLLDKLKGAGQGNIADSWVGTGQNQPINGDQVQDALGPDTISQLANKLGINASMLLPLLASLLPQIIDKLTPHGQAPAGGLGDKDDLLASLSNMLQKG